MTLLKPQRNALITALGGVALSLWVALWAADVARREAAQALDQAAEARFYRLRDGLGDYEEVLHGLRGFFAGSTKVDRSEFHHYLEMLDTTTRHPGVHKIAYAKRVLPAERERFSAEVRADRQYHPAGYPDFAIHPAGERPEHLISHFIEPLRGNEAAFGFDLAAEPERWEAAVRARDSGTLAATAPVRLVEETGQQKGFVLMLPIYRNGAPTATVEQRRQAFSGVVHAAFRMEDLAQGILGKDLEGFELSIVDWGPSEAPPSEEESVQTLLNLRTALPGTTHWREFRLDYGGRHWQVLIGTAQADAGWVLPGAILAGGALISLLLAALLHTQAGAQARAETQARRITRELRAASANSQAILDHTLDAIVTIDEHGRIESFNLAAERLFGRRAAEVQGQNVKLLMPEPYSSEHDGYLKAYRDTGRAKIIGIGREVVGRRADGSTFPMELAVTEVLVNEQRRFIGLVRDITERKRAEQLKSEFISTVSHELRTPLTSIRGSLGLVENGIAGELPAQAKTLIGIAVKNCERLVRLINEILDMEKIESGKMDFALQPQALMPLIEQVVEANQGFAAQHGTRYQITVRDDTGWVRIDADRLTQVLTNLLSNAAKYSPPDVPVTIEVSRQGDALRIAVRDQGSGIPPEFQGRIFEKFAQADGSTTREKGGSGLGLSIAKAMIERMGGQIGFDSAPGAGSCFWFSLPALATPSANASTPGKAPPAKPRILVCEADPVVAERLGRVLNQAGYDVDNAADVNAAQVLLDRHAYGALTIDLDPPGDSGVNLLRALSQKPGARPLPVVVFSSQHPATGFELGGVLALADWLDHPVEGEQLLAAIGAAMQAHGASGGRPRILHVEDDADLGCVIRTLLAELADVVVAPTLAAARRELASAAQGGEIALRYDLVILDIGLPDGSGLDLLPILKALPYAIPVIVFSASETDMQLTEEDAIAAVLVKSRTSNERLMQIVKDLTATPNQGHTPDKESK